MSKWSERLSDLVAVPKGFGLLTHETNKGFQIVESQDIPDLIPFVWSPLNSFFHEELVNHLQKSKAGIQEVKRIRIFRKSTGFVSDKYFTLTINNQIPFKNLSSQDFHPALINVVEGFHSSVFLSRDYYNLISRETSLLFQEDPIISLIPLGQNG